MKVLCVIPARFASTRLPGKPLKDIAGKPMVVRVFERASQARFVTETLVATDDERIKTVVESCGGKAMMTSSYHATGTDRLAEVALKTPDFDIIVNVQGDEPLIAPELIDELTSALFQSESCGMATVCTEIFDENEKINPNNVKVVCDCNGYALYFSRSLIPFPRHEGASVFKHIGIYAYRRDFLLRYAKMQSTPLEKSESLEQLRALENGYRIKVVKTDRKFIGVDTEEDLQKVNEIYRAMNLSK